VQVSSPFPGDVPLPHRQERDRGRGSRGTRTDDVFVHSIGADVLRPTAGRTALIPSHRPGAFPGLPQRRMPVAA
jgi:hypothetical protein